jgi:flavodoxin
MKFLKLKSINKQQGRIILGLLIILVVVSFLVVTGFMLWKDWSYFESEPYQRNADYPTNVLVLYYSRSGKTEAMAREIARKFQADIVNIKAETYGQGVSGILKANRDAWNKRTAVIEPETIDISNYRLIFLGSPIWWYRPAPPLWTFVEKNDFQGKVVVLFNTFNSRFKPEEIQEFQKLVENKGGRFLDHIYVRRGRIYNQLSGSELVEEVQKLLEDRESEWRRAIILK